MAEWVQKTEPIKQLTALLHFPQGIERRRQEEQGENDKIHDARKILQLPDQRRQQQADRSEGQCGEKHGGQHRDIARGLKADTINCRGREKAIGLQDRHRSSGDKFCAEHKPARQRAGQQHAHGAHLPVIDHGQRTLHAVEEKHHTDKSGYDIDFVDHVSLIGRRDGEPEYGTKSCRENQEPQQRPNEGGKEPLTLLQEPQHFAGGNA